jgi:hypothetical protein
MATAVPIADAYHLGKPTMFAREESGTGRPSEYEGLVDRTYMVMHIWRYLMSKKFELHESSIGDGHSFGPYFEANSTDAHFGQKYIIPFWTNEPSPVYTGDLGNIEAPAIRGQVVKMPLFGAESIGYNEAYMLYDGRMSRGAQVTFTLKPGSLRMKGFSYIMSGAYSRTNGLAYMDYVPDYDVGVVTTDAAFVEPGVTNAAARRWMTPHNPMINPMEGYREERSAIRYTYTGKREDPKIADFSEAVMTSTIGPFYLCHDIGAPAARTHHYVPSKYEKSLRSFESSFNPREALSRRFFNEEGEDPTLRGRVVEPPVEQEPVSSIPPAETPITHTEPGTGPPSLPPGPDTQIQLPTDVGLKQPTKTASFETGKQAESAAPAPGGD